MPSLTLRILLCSVRSTLADIQSFITDFLSVIDDNNLLPAASIDYLTSEGNLVDADVDGYGSTLNERHLLYWLNAVVCHNKNNLGYTNRLSEAGIGSATPTTLSQADPWGLADILRARGIETVIIDPDAVDDEDPSSTDGPVSVTYLNTSNNTCKLLDGVTDKASPNLFTTSTKDIFRYRLWGKTPSQGAWASFNETGGGSSCRIPNSDNPCVYLTRWSADNTLDQEVYFRKPTSFTATPAYVWIGGYPGEFPRINMGSSLDDDTTPTTVGMSAGSYRDQMILLSQTVTSPRDNFIFENLWLCGRRTTINGDKVYARQIIRTQNYGVGNHAIRHSKISHTHCILSTDYVASDFPDLVDFAYPVRVATGKSVTLIGINNLSAEFRLDSNHIEPVPTTEWPNMDNSAAFTIASSQNVGGKIQFTTVEEHDVQPGDIIIISDDHIGWDGESKVGQFTVASVDVPSKTITTSANWTGTTGGTGGQLRIPPVDGSHFYAAIGCDGGNTVTGMRVTRNMFTGCGASSILNLRKTDQLYFAYNESNAGGGGDFAYFSGPTNSTIEFNRITGWGRDYDAVGGKNGGGAITIDGGAWGNATNVVARYNVLYNTERMANGATRGIWTKDTQDGVTLYKNLVYRSQIYVDSDGTITTITVDIDQNLVSGLSEVSKVKAGGNNNAPIEIYHVTLVGNVPGTLNGQTTVTNNQIWRFENDTPNQLVAEDGPDMTIRNGYFFNVDDTLTGFTGNYDTRPDWAHDQESGDFTLNTDLIGFHADTPLTESLSKAWQYGVDPLASICFLEYDFVYTTQANLAEYTTPENLAEFTTKANLAEYTT